jgi:hypothetical protein
MRKIVSVIVATLIAAMAQACGGVDEPSPASDSNAAQVPAEAIDDAEQEIGGFSATLFPCTTTVEDDGSDVGGGYLIAPCYAVFSSRAVPIDPPIGMRDTERQVSFALSPTELPFARGIAEEIEISFPEHESMPPEVGNVIVPEVSTELPHPGVATLFECLFSSLCTPRP